MDEHKPIDNSRVWRTPPPAVTNGVQPVSFENMKHRIDSMVRQWTEKKAKLPPEEFAKGQAALVEAFLEASQMARKLADEYMNRVMFATAQIVAFSQEKPIAKG